MASSLWTLGLGCCILASLVIPACDGAYVITTPRKWVGGDKNQICVFVPNAASPAGSITAKLYTTVYRDRENFNETLVPEITFAVPEGKAEVCQELDTPSKDHYSAQLRLTGSVGGAELDETRNIRLSRSNNLTFIQTDKYLYQPGQKVQFRVLTIHGAEAKVATDTYPEIWVTTSSRTRIAQWKNVTTSSGLVHLSFQLADEPEQGTYTIHVRLPSGRTNTNRFKVEEYVLPKFEVKMTPPKYVLPTDDAFTFTVCAKYTFGQPLKGNFTFEATNNERRKCYVKVEKTGNITGCKDFEITAQEMRVADCSVYSIGAKVTVEEEGTSVARDASASVSVEREPVRFEAVYEDNYKKPFLPYTLKVKAKLPDGAPAAGVPVEVCVAGTCTNRTTAADGLFTSVVSSDNVNRVYMATRNCRADVFASSYSKEMNYYYSPTNSSLLIRVPDNAIKCVPGQSGTYNLPVLFSSFNQQRATFTVQIISRGKIQSWTTQDVEMLPGTLPIDSQHLVDTPEPLPEGLATGVIDLPVTIPPTASPKVNILVWYTRDDGEVVSDNAEVEVEKCLGYNTNLTWSAEQGQPGEATKLTVEAEPNAVCSVGVIDKSTELLSPNPDPITLNDIFNFVENFKIYPWINAQVNDYRYCEKKRTQERLAAESAVDAEGNLVPLPPIDYGPYSTYYVDALKMFDDSGLYVISDFTIETRPCEKEEEQIFTNFGISSGGSSGGFGGAAFGVGVAESDLPQARPPPPAAAFAPVGPAGASGPQNKEKVAEEDAQENVPRTDFPETWLWNLISLDATGVSESDLELPDSITQWVGKAVCAHPSKGVGLSPRAAITTFTPFFVDLTLPPSVKRTEVLPVKISVFNYLEDPLPVRVRLARSAEYDLAAESSPEAFERTSCLSPQDKAVHTIKIRPTAIGQVNLTVSAEVDYSIDATCGAANRVVKRDTLIKPIKVDPEGFLREKTWTKYVCADDVAAGNDTLDAWEVTLPETIVQGSDRGWVTAVGDLLALSLENLGHLIRMPYGCGEQNMVNFAPNIYIMQYLEATNQGTPESKEKLLNYMRTGYQRELLYRRSNGSYSAFGNADDSGSTWLTAFVLKSFGQAQDFIDIDEVALDQTRQWLSDSEQDNDGCVVSVGKVFHKGLKGGIASKGSSVPLTAYILSAVLEAGSNTTDPFVTNITKCVVGDKANDPYTMALRAYALALAKHVEATNILKQLIEMAVVEKNAMHWKLSDGGRYRSNSIALETAGYVILAMMAQDPDLYKLQAIDIIKWITTQRNGQGGFYSTQDTVVSLQAMASFEMHTHQGPLNVVAAVTATDFSHSFTVNEDNKLLQQLQPLPTFPTTINIDMTGQGCAIMQGVLRYNLPEPEPSDAFTLKVTPTSGGCVRKRLQVCSSYRLPDGKSNMAVIEVDLVSGFIPEKEDLKAAVSRNRGVVKRYEVDGSKISFYIEELTPDEVCVAFDVIREVEVEDTKRGSVTVFDYYQPEFSFSQRYAFPFREGCSR